MKKILFYVSALIGFVAFSACQNENSDLNVPENEKTLKVADFAEWGELHNRFLENVQENFEYSAEEARETVPDKIKKVLDFNLAFTDKMFTDEGEQETMHKEMVRYSNFVQADLFLSNALVTRTRSENAELSVEDIANIFNDSIVDLEKLPSLEQLNNAAFKGNLYSEKSYNLIRRLINALADNYKGLSSDAEYESKLLGIVEDFDALKFNETSVEGANLAVVLSISVASYNWWKSTPEAMSVNGKIPVLVANDVAGALVGAIGNMAYQDVFNHTHKFNWSTFGGAALTGAVTGSTGVVGKLGKFLAGL